MARSAQNVVRHPASVGVAAVRGDGAGRDYQELWFALSRRPWRSVVLVPTEVGASAAAIATSLSEVGRRLRETPVTFFIVADPLDPTSAGRLASQLASGNVSETPPPPDQPPGQVIVAIQPVITEPLGVAIAQAADLAVVCLEMGRSTTASVRRTLELLGRERVAGCILIR
jgi:hypothetical protein